MSPKDSRAALAGLEAMVQNGAAPRDGIWGGPPGVWAHPGDALCGGSARCPRALLTEKIPAVGVVGNWRSDL